MVAKGTWVGIIRTVLAPEQRTAKLPEDTQATPFLLRTKGWLLADAQPGDAVQVKTRTGRIEEGTLEFVNPTYDVNYGSFVPELLEIGTTARTLLNGGGTDAE